MKSCLMMSLVLTCGLGLLPGAARAEYLLGPGDALDISVFGSADFKRRAIVDVDGDVSLPFLGEVHAAGLGIDSLRKSVVAGLRKASVMNDPDVTVEIAEYRPFFITGDVARPGAVAYRPGLTARVAVALAGGYDALRFRVDNPLLSGPGYRSDYESLWAELVREQARAATLQAELDGRSDADLSALSSAPLSKSVVERIADLEKRDFSLRLAMTTRDRTFLSSSMKRVDGDIADLRTSMTKQALAIQIQEESGARMRDAQSRGIVSGFRTAEDSRDLSQLRNAQDQSSSRLAEAITKRADLVKRIDAFDDERRARTGRELQDMVVGMEKTRSQIRSASERLIYTGALKAQLRNGPAPDIIIHRREGDQTIALNATEETSVIPDDVVDVIIRPDQLVVTPTQ